MITATVLFPKTQDAHPDPEPYPHRGGETSGGGETPASFAERETTSVAADGGTSEESSPSTTSSGDREKRASVEEPPTDDVCPICFGDFDVPCRAPCGHWYCGSCILQYWNFSAALQPCKCPMCSRRITRLTPEASLYQRHQAEITKVLRSVRDYNRLFVGGISGFMLKFLAIPLFMKRMFLEMLNPDRPGVHLQEMRAVAVKFIIDGQLLFLFLGILYSFIPLDFLRIGRRNIIDVFDYSAFVLSFILYLAGLYLRRRRERNVRELQERQGREFVH